MLSADCTDAWLAEARDADERALESEAEARLRAREREDDFEAALERAEAWARLRDADLEARLFDFEAREADLDWDARERDALQWGRIDTLSEWPSLQGRTRCPNELTPWLQQRRQPLPLPSAC